MSADVSSATGEGTSFAAGQVMTIFRSRRRPDGEDSYRRTAHDMESKARATPGFVDFKTFTADDGEHLSVITFATLAAHRAWRDDPRHRLAQKLGRDQFYLEYSIQVGECAHALQWARPE